MSGGPYGRGKAPERACMKIADWPSQDRAIWREALVAGDLLDEGGSRSNYSDASNRKAEKGYGRFLTFLVRSNNLDPVQASADRITPANVKAFVDHLRDLGNSTQTLMGRLQELGEMTVVFAPDRDWRFINRMAAKIRSGHAPARDKQAKLVLSDDLLDLGIRLMETATTESTPRLRAISYRDGLIIALLALDPLRRKNFAALELDRTLLRVGDAWTIVIPAAETKTHDPIETLFPEFLVPMVERYLVEHRPILAGLVNRWSSSVGQALWVSSHVSPMTEMAIYDRVRARTEAAFGRRVNLHLFRDAAATTMAIEDPEHVRLAASLLGHRSFATTERYYRQSRRLEAHRRFASVISSRRAREDKT